MIGFQFPEGGQPVPGYRQPDPDLYEDRELLFAAHQTYPDLHPALRRALEQRGLMPVLLDEMQRARERRARAA